MASTKLAEGKTTMTSNLAFAGAGEKVILVDADLRKPKLHKFFQAEGDNSSPGLSRFLAGVGSKGLVCQNGLANLCFIPAGPVPPNPLELLTSDRFAMLIQALTRRFGYQSYYKYYSYCGYGDAKVKRKKKKKLPQYLEK